MVDAGKIVSNITKIDSILTRYLSLYPSPVLLPFFDVSRFVQSYSIVKASLLLGSRHIDIVLNT